MASPPGRAVIAAMKLARPLSSRISTGQWVPNGTQLFGMASSAASIASTEPTRPAVSNHRPLSARGVLSLI
jgi:hypothetical protein